MPFSNTRDVCVTRFESDAGDDTETNILKGPFVNISRIVGISRAYSLHKCISMTNPLPRDLNTDTRILWTVPLVHSSHIFSNINTLNTDNR